MKTYRFDLQAVVSVYIEADNEEAARAALAGLDEFPQVPGGDIDLGDGCTLSPALTLDLTAPLDFECLDNEED